jgi:hypothetical protein
MKTRRLTHDHWTSAIWSGGEVAPPRNRPRSGEDRAACRGGRRGRWSSNPGAPDGGRALGQECDREDPRGTSTSTDSGFGNDCHPLPTTPVGAADDHPLTPQQSLSSEQDLPVSLCSERAHGGAGEIHVGRPLQIADPDPISELTSQLGERMPTNERVVAPRQPLCTGQPRDHRTPVRTRRHRPVHRAGSEKAPENRVVRGEMRLAGPTITRVPFLAAAVDGPSA